MAIESFADIKRATFQWRNFLSCFTLAFGLFAYGYDAGVISTTLTKPSFLTYVHLMDDEGKIRGNATGLSGATIGLFQVIHRPSLRSLAYIMTGTNDSHP